jgi:hypothetical protein
MKFSMLAQNPYVTFGGTLIGFDKGAQNFNTEIQNSQNLYYPCSMTDFVINNRYFHR